MLRITSIQSPPKSADMIREDDSALLLNSHDDHNHVSDNDVRKSNSSTIAQMMIPSSRENEDAILIEDGCDPTPTYSSGFSSLRQRYSGWKGGLVIAMTVDITVLLILLSLTLVAAFAYPRDGDNATLIKGDCSKTKTSQTWLHLLINILSTSLLATSSYVMQCLSSPTRAEIEDAHMKGKAMDIGVPSFTNLFRVRKRRVACYLSLLLTSLPIHLLANSAIFGTIGANSYLLIGAWENLLTTPLEDLNQGYIGFASGYHSMEDILFADNTTAGNSNNTIALYRSMTRLIKDLQPRMERLDKQQCIEAYANPLSPTRSNVIVVYDEVPPPVLTNATNTTNFISQLYYQTVDFCPQCQTFKNWTDPAAWTCAFTTSAPLAAHSCDTRNASTHANLFAVEGMPISYCMSEPAEERCLLEANLPILAVVTACALFKVIIVYASLRSLPSRIFATIGDAMASFLDCPDTSTAGCSLLDKSDIENEKWKPGQVFAKPWKSSAIHARWGQGPSVMLWSRTIMFMLAITVIAVVLFSAGLRKFTTAGPDVNSDAARAKSIVTPPLNTALLMQLGFGTVNINTLLSLANMSSPTNIIGHVLLVNTPQLALSFIYFSYNACWTNMLVAREWAKYGKERKSLRTSLPAGSQRHTYFLTIPYRFAIPLLLCSTLLHWLLSQSFFLARINVYPAAPFVTTAPAVINTAGYSLIALMIFIILWAIMLTTSIMFGVFGKLKSPIPLVGSSSVAISAACHPPQTEIQPALKPVMWGIIDTMEHEDGTKHCSFTSMDVYSPEKVPQKEVRLSVRTLMVSEVLFA